MRYQTSSYLSKIKLLTIPASWHHLQISICILTIIYIVHVAKLLPTLLRPWWLNMHFFVHAYYLGHNIAMQYSFIYFFFLPLILFICTYLFIKVHRVLSYHNYYSACAQRSQFHILHSRDRLADVQPFNATPIMCQEIMLP